MNDKFAFQYQILRYQHDAFTGEHLNIGLALYSPSAGFIKIKIRDRVDRLISAFPNLDRESFKQYSRSLQSQFDHVINQFNIDKSSLFPEQNLGISRILSKVLAVDDAAIQFGKTHYGHGSDLESAFRLLYANIVEKYIESTDYDTRTEDDIWRIFKAPLEKKSAAKLLHQQIFELPSATLKLDHAWKNGKYSALQPISFDLANPDSISRKSINWYGRNVLIHQEGDLKKVYYLLGKPNGDTKGLLRAYDKAKDLLGTGDFATKIELIEEDAADDFVDEISKTIIRDTQEEMD